MTMASHIATKLTPGVFRTWAGSSTHALLVAVREEPSRSVAEPDGSGVLGYALLVLGEPDGAAEADAVRAAAATAGPYVELSKIYVRPDVQGAGVSDLLMSAAVDAAAELAHDQGHRSGLPLWLGTNGLNARAQGFYRRHGFTTVGTRTYVVGGVEHDDVVMLHTADHG
jgi:GNAT superfamily N-acetyltransferase